MASTFTNLLYHIVFSTKHRRPLISAELKPELHKYIGGIIRNKNGILLEIGGTPDHVHLVAKFRAEPSVATMLELIKANSSKWVNEQSDRRTRFEWQVGYAAFSVSESQLGKVQDYVRSQERHHQQKTFQEEFVALLKKHGINYDERYLWD